MNIIFLWALFGAFAILLEASAISGIGLFFAGLAGFCVAVLINFKAIAVDNFTAQLIWFFALTTLWAALLWKPLQRILNVQSEESVPDLVGDTAILTGDLIRGQKAQAGWSGTWMNAELSESETVDMLPAGTKVRIVKVVGNILQVTRI